VAGAIKAEASDNTVAVVASTAVNQEANRNERPSPPPVRPDRKRRSPAPKPAASPAAIGIPADASWRPTGLLLSVVGAGLPRDFGISGSPSTSWLRGGPSLCLSGLARSTPRTSAAPKRRTCTSARGLPLL
jgi:hypothetical protein